MSKLIAEIGLNHLGDKSTLKKMYKRLIFNEIYGVTVQILEDNYYDGSTKFRRELKIDAYKEMAIFLKKKKIKFGIATNNIQTINKFKSVRVDFWKIISPKFFDDKLISAAIKTKKDVYLSCGIASISDITRKFRKYKKIKFIHTSFSDKIKDANLNAIENIKKKIKRNISFGLHARMVPLIISAITLKVESIFFYVKFDDNKKYPDHFHAVNIENLKNYLEDWKKISISMGDGIKRREKLPKWVFE